MYGFAASFLQVAKPILSNRLLINIRKAGMGKDKDREAISTLVFAKNPVRVQSATEHSAETEVTAGEEFTVPGSEGDMAGGGKV
jgi:hypothetical protein